MFRHSSFVIFPPVPYKLASLLTFENHDGRPIEYAFSGQIIIALG
jgi:hypothetical protein